MSEPTKVFLLYQWTEEREGKDIFGIYAELGDAKTVAQLDYITACTDYGITPRPLNWLVTPSRRCEWFAEGTRGDENGYSIEEHAVDTYQDTRPSTRKAI